MVGWIRMEGKVETIVIDEGSDGLFMLRILGRDFDKLLSAKEILDEFPNVLEDISPNLVKIEYDSAIKIELPDYFVQEISRMEKVHNIYYLRRD